jgi:type 1 glutamine amidotransferase
VSADADADDGFRQIFDGKTLTGWDGDPGIWQVKDGAITGITSTETPLKTNTFIIWKRGLLDDFELKLQYRIVNGNSGIQYRSRRIPEVGNWAVGGYQADFEAGDTYSGILYDERGRGVLALRGDKTVVRDDHKPLTIGKVGESAAIQARIKKEDWNDYHIVARGHHFIHRINGVTTVEVHDEDAGARQRSGILAMQAHVGPAMIVQFRNIRLKRLPMGDRKKIVLIAGQPSHGYGAHDHYAGCRILKHAIDQNMPGLHAVVYRSDHPEDPNGWTLDPTALDNADAIVLYMDGGDGHPVRAHLDEMAALMKRGVGLACIHYAVEIPKGRDGDAFLDWIGGYFEANWSVNPHWDLENPTLAVEHPITRGVEPFDLNDEWYFHMRFRPDMEGVQSILSAHPPKSTLERPDGPHSNNPDVRATIKRGEPQILAWARERPDGGRGFGFTGAHKHQNWRHDGFRTLLLNAITWIAKAEVPADGVRSRTPTDAEMEANMDYPKPD